MHIILPPARAGGSPEWWFRESPEWRKSSWCKEGNECVEVALLDHGAAVRDSKFPTQCLVFKRPAWKAFVADLKHGRFDR